MAVYLKQSFCSDFTKQDINNFSEMLRDELANGVGKLMGLKADKSTGHTAQNTSDSSPRHGEVDPQHSFDSGSVSKKSRIVNITPLLVKGWREKTQNYTPGSLMLAEGKNMGNSVH